MDSNDPMEVCDSPGINDPVLFNDPSETNDSIQFNDSGDSSDPVDFNDAFGTNDTIEFNDPFEQNDPVQLNDPIEISDPIDVVNDTSEGNDRVQFNDPIEISDPIEVDRVQFNDPLEISDPIEVDRVQFNDPIEISDPIEVVNDSSEQNDPVQLNDPIEISNPIEVVNDSSEQNDPDQLNDPIEVDRVQFNDPIDISDPIEVLNDSSEGNDPVQLNDPIVISDSIVIVNGSSEGNDRLTANDPIDVIDHPNDPIQNSSLSLGRLEACVDSLTQVTDLVGFLNLPFDPIPYLASPFINPNSPTPYTDALVKITGGKVNYNSRTSSGKVKQPINSFMIYYCIRTNQVRALQVLYQVMSKIMTDSSKLIAEHWASMNAEQRSPYTNEREWLKQMHRKEFPDYKYVCRKKPKSKKVETTFQGTVMPQKFYIPVNVPHTSQMPLPPSNRSDRIDQSIENVVNNVFSQSSHVVSRFSHLQNAFNGYFPGMFDNPFINGLMRSFNFLPNPQVRPGFPIPFPVFQPRPGLQPLVVHDRPTFPPFEARPGFVPTNYTEQTVNNDSPSIVSGETQEVGGSMTNFAFVNPAIEVINEDNIPTSPSSSIQVLSPDTPKLSLDFYAFPLDSIQNESLNERMALFTKWFKTTILELRLGLRSFIDPLPTENQIDEAKSRCSLLKLGMVQPETRRERRDLKEFWYNFRQLKCCNSLPDENNFAKFKSHFDQFHGDLVADGSVGLLLEAAWSYADTLIGDSLYDD